MPGRTYRQDAVNREKELGLLDGDGFGRRREVFLKEFNSLVIATH
jgi:hypothetical protein